MKMKRKSQINISNNEKLVIKDNIIYISDIEKNVQIEKNNNLIIEKNRIIVCEGLQLNRNGIDWTLRNSEKYKELYEFNYKEKNTLRREIKLREKLQKFIFYSEKNSFVPTIRIYAYFSAFSTIRQSYETDDLSQLEIEENALFIRLVELGFKVKVIISLQAELIIRQGYSIEQYEERSKNLVNTIKNFNIKQYKNLQIVIDEYQSHDSTLILDTILIIKSDYLQFDGNNFQYTLFESDRTILKNEILEFDKNFDELYFRNYSSKLLFKIKDDFDFVKYISNTRKNSYIENQQIWEER